MRTRLWTLTGTAVAVTAAAALLAVSPKAGPATAWPTPSPVTVPSRDPRVDGSDPAAVCLAFAAAVFTRDTTTDHGPGDSYIRAAAYADARFAAALSVPVRDVLPGWDTWAAHRAHIVVQASPAAGDVDTASSVTVAVTATATGRDGWTGPAEHALVHCQLQQADSRYLVTGYGIEPS